MALTAMNRARCFDSCQGLEKKQHSGGRFRLHSVYRYVAIGTLVDVKVILLKKLAGPVRFKILNNKGPSDGRDRWGSVSKGDNAPLHRTLPLRYHN